MTEPSVRNPLPGELCACGAPAKLVLIRDLGDVPTCRGPGDFAADVVHLYNAAERVLRRARGV